jgi:hypothetical protein
VSAGAAVLELGDALCANVTDRNDQLQSAAREDLLARMRRRVAQPPQIVDERVERRAGDVSDVEHRDGHREIREARHQGACQRNEQPVWPVAALTTNRAAIRARTPPMARNGYR